MMKRNHQVMAVSLGLALVFAGSSVVFAADDPEPAVISVTGRSEKKVEPDFARLHYAVVSEAETASECQDENDEAVRQTVDMLKELGIEESFIKTNFSMNPKYTNSSIVSSSSIDGYEAYTELTVSDVPVASLGDIIGSSVESGVNVLKSIDYYSSRYDETYNEALADAMAMAQRKADVLAKAAGYKLEGPPSVSESDYNDYYRYSSQEYNGDMAFDEAEDVKSVYVSPGELTIDADISVVYHMGPVMSGYGEEVSEDVMTSTDAVVTEQEG